MLTSGVCSIGYDELIAVLLLRQQRGHLVQPAPGLWNGRAGELRPGTGELLLVTFAEVRPDETALRQHRPPDVCNPYTTMAPERAGRPLPLRTIWGSAAAVSAAPADQFCNSSKGAVGVSSNPASTGSSFRGNRDSEPIGRRGPTTDGAVGLETGESDGSANRRTTPQIPSAPQSPARCFKWSRDVSRLAWRADRLAAIRVSFQMLPKQPAPELLDAIAAADGLGYFACYSRR